MDPSEYFNYFLPALRKFITTALKNRSNQSVRTKYGWLRTKFNEQYDFIEQRQSNRLTTKKIK